MKPSNPRFRLLLAGVFLLAAGGAALGANAIVNGISTARDAAQDAASVTPAAGARAGTEAKVAGSGQTVGGAFDLVDHNGVDVTDQDFADRYKIVFFGFTHCPDICPLGLQKISAALDLLGEDANAVYPLFVTVDPARDTPQAMKEYAALFDKRLIGLTGTEEQIADMQKTYKVYAARAEIGGSAAGKEPARGDAHSDTHGAGHHEEGGEGHGAHGASTANYTVNHSGYIYFMSPDSQLISLFGDDDTPSAIADGIRSHLHRKH